MKVLITGSNGMLGKALLETFKDGKLYGIGSARAAKNQAAGFFEYEQCDITDRDDVRSTVSRIRPDAVVHAAAFTQVDDCEREQDKAMAVNFTGTAHVADAAGEHGAFLIFVSTDYVFDGRKKSPYVEDDPTGPLNVYGRSKLAAENYLRQRAGGYLIARTSWVYGPGGKNFVEAILRLSAERETLEVVKDQTGRPTYTYDLAAAIFHLCDYAMSGAGQGSKILPPVLHVANCGAASWFDFAKEIVLLSGRKVAVKPILAEQLKRPAARPENSVLDTARFDALLKKPLREWKESLRDYMKLLGKSALDA